MLPLAFKTPATHTLVKEMYKAAFNSEVQKVKRTES
jgi:hypothetical protein